MWALHSCNTVSSYGFLGAKRRWEGGREGEWQEGREGGREGGREACDSDKEAAEGAHSHLGKTYYATLSDAEAWHESPWSEEEEDVHERLQAAGALVRRFPPGCR